MSGQSIDVADGLTAIVGPNNVGKSLFLRELHARIMVERDSMVNPPQKVVQSYEINYQGSVDDLLAILRLRCIEQPPGQYQNGAYAEPSFQLPNDNVLPHSQIHHKWWSQTCLGILRQYFVLYLGAEDRLGMAGNSVSFNLLIQQPNSPVQLMYANRALANKVSSLIERAFNQPLTVNRYGGSEITLHLGKVEAEETKPPISLEYMRELSLLPQLQEQGDGIRAFAGMPLAIITAQYPLVIIDEPEAFLHPPQAYLFGRVLAEQHAIGTQIPIATHSKDVIAGITSVKTTTDNVSIVRLTRKATVNHAAQIHRQPWVSSIKTR
ncbi:MAG: AAA family ATPase [Pseudonocardiaceae bacterium]